MAKIILASHGGLSAGMLDSVKMIVGELAADVETYSLLPGRNPNEYVTELRERIRHERRIELAFEDHRFWDVRRWMIAPETLGKPLKGVEITRAGSSFSYNVINVENRTFQNRMYFYPIPQKDLNIVGTSWPQNPMW